MKIKVYKTEDCRKCKPTIVSQIDNVYRDGFVSIKEQFAEFQRAGINRMQWLAKAYPSEKTIEHEKALFEARDELMRAEYYNQGDSLNVLDGAIQASNELALAKSKYENMNREKLAEIERLKQEEIQKYKDFYEQNKDKKQVD